MKVENRTLVVSGGSSGLGWSTVQHLIAQKVFVAIFDLVPPVLSSPNVKFFQTNITILDQITSAVQKTVEWTSQTDAALGGVINCAGVGYPAPVINRHGKPHSLELWQLIIDVNLTGSFNLTRLVLAHLVKVTPEAGTDGERGVVVFIASTAAFDGPPNTTAYSASKGALCSMALPMARDLAGHSIRVVTIVPGVFETPIITARFRKGLERETILYPRRFGQPDEFAKTVMWILDCPFVNGESIRVNGGARMSTKL